MGTAKQWFEVVLSGALWALIMLLIPTFRDRKTGQPFLNILGTVVGGFWVGLLTTFRWQQLVKEPLIYLVIPAFVVTVLAVLLCRMYISRNQSKASSTPG